MRVEELDQLGKIGERACETVDLVDDDNVDAFSLDVFDEILQCGTIKRTTGETAIIEAFAQQL